MSSTKPTEQEQHDKASTEVRRFALHVGRRVFFVYALTEERAREHAHNHGITSIDRITAAGRIVNGSRFEDVPPEYDGQVDVDHAPARETRK